MSIELIGPISHVETIATGRGIGDLARLRKVHGRGRWRKRKGVARVRLPDGAECLAELQWYEAHGVGRRDVKIKRMLEDGP